MVARGVIFKVSDVLIEYSFYVFALAFSSSSSKNYFELSNTYNIVQHDVTIIPSLESIRWDEKKKSPFYTIIDVYCTIYHYSLIIKGEQEQ